MVDMMSRDCSSVLLPVSRFNSGPLSPGPTQPIAMETDAVGNTWSSPVPMEAVVSLVEPDLTVHSSPLVPAVPEVRSSVLMSLTIRSVRKSLSPNSVQPDRSFYSSTDSRTCQTPVTHQKPTVGREEPFVAAYPHPRIENDMGGFAYRFTTYRDSNFAVMMISLLPATWSAPNKECFC